MVMWNVLLLICSVVFSVPELEISGDVMFVGMENMVKLKLNGADPEDVSVKVSLGTLRKINDSTYVYIPQSTNDDIKIKLYHKKIVCDIHVVSVRDLPAPRLVFAREVKGILKRKDLSSPGKLSLVYDGVSDRGPDVSVYQFSCLLTDTNGRFLVSKNVRGDVFDDRIMQEFSRFKNVGQMVISNVMIKTMQGVRRLEVTKTIKVTD